VTLRIRNESQLKQLQLGDLVTNEIIRPILARQQRKQANKLKPKPNEIFAQQLKDEGIAHLREYKVPAYHLTPKTQQQAYWHMDVAVIELEQIILVEIQGGIWKPGGGAHSHPIDIERNIAKQNDAARRGFPLYQFTTKQVKNGAALDYLLKVMAERGWRARA
jgi:hypothetical protein